MQRRSYIRSPTDPRDSLFHPRDLSPPDGSAPMPMAASSLSRPRLHQSPIIRVALGLVLIGSLFAFFHLLSDAHSLNTYSSRTRAADLHPRDYLNASRTSPAPFDFCPIFGPGDAIATKYGTHALSKSILYQSSGGRVNRVIQKALSGNPVTISILGGTVSACHGAGDDPTSPQCYPSLFYNWWSDVFPHPATELTNGAAQKINSAYFSYCSAHHLPDYTDLIILEFDSDDADAKDTLTQFELLVRSLLLRPEKPAVIILGHFAPQLQEIHGYAGPERIHSLIAQFYDVPHISTKGLLYNNYLSNPTLVGNNYFMDPIIPNQNGHRLLADVLIHYIETQICASWSAVLGYSFDVPRFKTEAEPKERAFGSFGPLGGIGGRKSPVDSNKEKDKDKGSSSSSSHDSSTSHPSLQVPPFTLSTRPDGVDKFVEVEPNCVSAQDLVNPVPPSLFYGTGWTQHIPPPGASRDGRENYYYWSATNVGSRLRVPLKVGSGDVAIWYLSEPKSIVGKRGSKVSCWVDDNYTGAVEIHNLAEDDSTHPSLKTIDHHVTSGSHYVECEILGEEGLAVPAFKLLGVFCT